MWLQWLLEVLLSVCSHSLWVHLISTGSLKALSTTVAKREAKISLTALWTTSWDLHLQDQKIPMPSVNKIARISTDLTTRMISMNKQWTTVGKMKRMRPSTVSIALSRDAPAATKTALTIDLPHRSKT